MASLFVFLSVLAFIPLLIDRVQERVSLSFSSFFGLSFFSVSVGGVRDGYWSNRLRALGCYGSRQAGGFSANARGEWDKSRQASECFSTCIDVFSAAVSLR